jgi:protein phosphatase
MTYQINYAYTCHTGRVRPNNEDNFWCCGSQMPVEHQGMQTIFTGSISRFDSPVFAVFDGMGGESCGEIASGIAAEECGRQYEKNKKKIKKDPEDFIRNAVSAMNTAVCRYEEENKIHSMGTTMAMAVFGNRAIHLCNLGDSRIYYLHNGQIHQLSTDHVMGGNLFGKAPLTQYLGIPETAMALEVLPVENDYCGADRYLLCTDGMTDMLTDAEIAGILTRESAVEETVQILLEESLQKGGRDNVTIILCEVREQETKNPVLEWVKRHRKERQGSVK